MTKLQVAYCYLYGSLLLATGLTFGIVLGLAIGGFIHPLTLIALSILSIGVFISMWLEFKDKVINFK